MKNDQKYQHEKYFQFVNAQEIYDRIHIVLKRIIKRKIEKVIL